MENSLVNVKSVASSNGINLEKLFNKYGIKEKELLDKADIKLNEILDAVTVKQLKELILDKNFITLVKESIPKESANYDKIQTYLDDFSKNRENIKKLFAGVRKIENGYIEYNKNLKLINENEDKLNKANKEYKTGLKKYNSGMQEYKAGLKKYNSGMEEYKAGIKKYESGIKEYNSN